MFESFSVISSAGSTLLIPDCELTHLQAFEAFYLKQTVFAFLPIIIIFVCCFVWVMIWLILGKCSCTVRNHQHHLMWTNIKDYTILSIVLLLFLAYPMQVRLALSMIQCVKIGEEDVYYLLADLEVKCFVDDHSFYAGTLFIPQLFLYVIGLPLAALVIILRNSEKIHGNHTDETLSHHKSFRMRYGLLYMGYAKNRAWWEVISKYSIGCKKKTRGNP